MLPHILGLERDASTITGHDHLGTINERLYIIFPGTRHYKACQMEGKVGTSVKRGRGSRKRELQDQVLVQICQRHLA